MNRSNLPGGGFVMQSPEEMLKRTYAAKPRGAPEPAREAEKRELPERKLVMNPIKQGGVYRQLMASHDRMRTRHLG
jgi:hypothetical protein